MIDSIYYDGDSFSCLGVEKNTGDFIANHFNARLIHKGQMGKSPIEIINDFLNIEHNSSTLYFIGFGVRNRNIDINNKGEICPLTQEQYVKKYVDSFITEEYNTLVSLLMLSGYCRSKHLKYIIHNLDYGAFEHMSKFDISKNIVEEVKRDPNIIGYFDDSSLHHLMKQHNLPGFDADLYKDVSHPTQEGHQMYANFLINHMVKIYNLTKSNGKWLAVN